MMDSKQLDLHLIASAVFLIAFLSFCPSSWAHNKNLRDIPQPVQVDDFRGCFEKVYAFGDSSTDTGNGFILGIVKAFVKQFMARRHGSSFSSGEGALEGHRLSNGRLVVDFLCEALGKPTLKPYKQVSANFSGGVNFAVAGSTALPNQFSVSAKFNFSLKWQWTPQSYATQIDWFNKYVDENECLGKNPLACKSSIGNALFWVGAFGRNDYARVARFSIASLFSKRLTRLCVEHVTNVIAAVLEKGAKFVVVEGLPPAGCQSMELSLCSPFDYDEFGCSFSTNAWIRAHNDLLQEAIDVLRTTFSDATIVYADYYGAYQSILANHKLYQIAEPFKACCGAGTGELHFDLSRLCGLPGTSTCKHPSKYINWDGLHLTETMNRHLADLLFNHGHCKPSFQELIAKKKAALAAHVMLHH